MIAASGRILALDVGDVRTGIALSDELGLTVRALETIPTGQLAVRLPQLVEEHQAFVIVVGRPRSLDGSVGAQVSKIEATIAALRPLTDARFEYEDETGSTKAAEAAGAADSDAAAAAEILRGYLAERAGA